MHRNAQFEYINKKAGSFLTDDQPVISVDTNKMELVGIFKNAGRDEDPKVDSKKPMSTTSLIPAETRGALRSL